jgi:hypothetical protein
MKETWAAFCSFHLLLLECYHRVGQQVMEQDLYSFSAKETS